METGVSFPRREGTWDDMPRCLTTVLVSGVVGPEGKGASSESGTGDGGACAPAAVADERSSEIGGLECWLSTQFSVIESVRRISGTPAPEWPTADGGSWALPVGDAAALFPSEASAEFCELALELARSCASSELVDEDANWESSFPLLTLRPVL